MFRTCDPPRALRPLALLAAAVTLLGSLTVAWADVPTTVPSPGLRESTPDVIAFKNARLVLAPGRVVQKGTLVVRDGVIVAAGTGVSIPADAVQIDALGKTIYPGLIDGYSTVGQPKGDDASAPRGPGGFRQPAPAPPDVGTPYWNPLVTPQTHAHLQFRADSTDFSKLRSQGVTAAVSVPAKGLVKGTSAVVLLGDEATSRLVIKPDVALDLAITVVQDFGRNGYPTSPMGAYTLVRQSLYDADWYTKAWAAWQKDKSLPKPETNAALEALHGYAGSLNKLVVIECEDEHACVRAEKLAKEFGLHAILRGSGMEYRRLDEVRALNRAIIVPVNFPKAPALDNADQEKSVELTDLLHWDFAPENPARLSKAGVTIALTSDGLKDKAQFLKMVKLAVARGLDPDKALAALTTTPASLYGVSDRMGTIDAGKIANFVITDGNLFDDKTRVLSTWVAGKRYDVVKTPAVDPRGTWKLTLAGKGSAPTLKLEGDVDRLSGSLKDGAEAKLKSAQMTDALLAMTLPGDSLGLGKGTVRMSATVLADEMMGDIDQPDGKRWEFSAVRSAPYVAPPDTARNKPEPMASFPVPLPFSAFGRERVPEQPDDVAFTHATIWTSGPAGKIEDGTLLVHKGKVAGVGKNVSIPKGATIVDATGKHISPGIIDCHSHSATDGGVNEGGQTVTAEVRIGDFLDEDDVNIYRELAGGTTEAHVLHGSANTIGGQCQLIKLRWGMGQDDLKFAGWLPTIKFALGENVKQSYAPQPTGRYPQTRMGVEQLLRDEFTAAKNYRAQWSAWNANHRGIPPRRDLELDAVSEILEGKRYIHCHSYRQDEILSLMKVCDEYGATIGALQHILEGYKVSDEIAKRGIGASTFSDWWAYKLEVTDAIPYNAALMENTGVVVSMNSDSNELARRLNTEAGKTVKYGGLSEEEALKTVTWNPARQLRVEKQVGSLENGKDADFVVWSGPPLLYQSLAEETWIDGRRFFDRDEDLAMRAKQDQMRATLVQKAMAQSARDEGKNPFEAKRRVAEDVSCEYGLHEGEGR
ncbi:MAG TPA: amidohydrolase family protein [Candidatus Eisenbacteria bacterium]|nr:amidohydrolase family protein [Candidatus Eisenbacteria bacterium]